MSTTRDRKDPTEIAEDEEVDDLDELIAEIAQEHPEFPAMVEAALQERIAARARGEDPNGLPDTDGEEESQDGTPQVAASRHDT